jgi:hypothetical protein
MTSLILHYPQAIRWRDEKRSTSMICDLSDGSLGNTPNPASATRTCPLYGAINGLRTRSDRAVMNLSLPTPLANTQLKSRSSRLDSAFV